MTHTFDVESKQVHFILLAREVVGTAYRALPRIVAVSVLWSVLAATVLLAAPATVIVFAAAASVLDGRHFSVNDAIHAFRHYFWRSQAAFVPFIVLLDGAGGLWFFAGASGHTSSAIGAFLMFDLLMVYSFLMLYYIPLLVERDEPAIKTARASATLTVSRVRASIGLYVFTLSIVVLLAFTVAGFVLVGPGLVATTILLSMRYVGTDDS